jgi:integrase
LSLDVRVWAVDARKGKKTTYRVRWSVAGQVFPATFATKELAERWRGDLRKAQRNGEDFDEATGLPESMERQRSQVTFYQHCREFTASAWPSAAAKSRVSIIETLSRVVPVAVKAVPGGPDPGLLRRSLRVALNPRGRELAQDEARAIAWITRASRPISSLEDPAVVTALLDALATKLDGKPAAPDYFTRRRQVLHRVLGYGVRQKRLKANPLSRGQIPEGWTAPMETSGAIDPRVVGSPALIADVLDSCATAGRRARRMRGFFAVMFYGLARPSEVAMLTADDCQLPPEGWGALTFTGASPAAGKAFTDDGQVHEQRGLKGRTRGRPRPGARTPVRRVPVPPELVVILREHLETYGTAPDGRLFRSETGSLIHPSHWYRCWQQVRETGLTPEQAQTPLLRRPYDLRHSGVTWRLNSGIPPAEVAAWAGHSVEILMRVYARCTAGQEDVWIAKMDATLGRG